MASEVNFKNLINITSAGMNTASYSEILNFLIIKYKEAYGDNIEIKNESADGIFLHNVALEINTILETCKEMYSNFDINYATGKALDNLCALSSLFRKPATNSTAKVTIYNLGNAQVDLPSIVAVDINGNRWLYNQPVSIDANDTLPLNLTCEISGPIEAKVGAIYQLSELPNNVILSITQTEDALVGSSIESDADLRERKLKAASPEGVTVLDSLVGNLLQISGIKDALIYNNADGTVTPKDSTTVDQHDIYIVLRYNENVENKNIGDVIYNKLTPGVMTTQTGSDADYGSDESYDYYPEVYGINNSQYSTTIYWKKAKPVHPTISIQFTNVLNMYFTEDFVKGVIGKGLIDYLNDLPLSTNITADDIKVKMFDLDPRYSGNWDFALGTVTVNSASSYTNSDTYYDYTTLVYNAGTKTLTLS